MVKQKKFYLKYILALFVSFIATFAMIGSAQSVKADQDWGDQFITHAELQDENGNPQTSFGIYDNMQAHWDFNVPAGTDIKSGDTMTVDVPDVLTLQSDVSFDIKDAAGNVIGHAMADHNTGKVTITFTDYAAEAAKNGITGSFNLWVHWDHSKVDENTTVPVDWGTGGETDINVDPGNDKPDDNEGLYKWGNVDANDPTLIHWTVRVNFALTDIQNAVYEDTVGPNQELVSGSIAGYHVASWNSDWSPVPGEALPSSIITQTDPTHFSINFGELKDCVYINYDTRATDGGNSSKYQNSGALSGDNIETHTVDVYTPDNGGGGDGETTVSISGTKTWIDDDNAVGLRPNSITIDLFQNDQKIDSKVVTESDNWAYSFTKLPKYDANNQEYKYTVKEEAVDNYLPTQDGNNFINTITGETQIKGQKTWIDNDNSAKKRPDSIVINLLADGKKIASKTVTEKDGWSYDFGSLPKYQNGKMITYSVTEDFVKDYTTTISGYNVTNTYNEPDPVTPDQPKPTPSDTDKVQPSDSQESDKTGNLPRTGDNSSISIIAMILGILVLGFGISLIIFKIKEKNS